MNFKKFIYIKLNIFIFIILFFIIYIIKLNDLINLKIKDKYFLNLPIIIYSKIININCKINLTKKEIINILYLSKYIKKNKISKPGEFSIDNNSLILFKRSFYFPNKYENKIILKMLFNNNNLLKITDLNNNYIDSIDLDPQIISIINSNNNKQKVFMYRKDFPDTLVDMLIEIEDKKYYTHNGINFSSILRAFIKNINNKKIIEGGSTLTQQLARNLFLNNNRNLIRKINEIFIALLIEYKFSKEKILELYLNEVYFGNIGDKEIRGFPLGSIYYFGKLINELNLNEQATLIGMLKGASLYNPWKNPNLVNKRKNLILNNIKLKKIIDNQLYNFLKSEKYNFKHKNDFNINYPSFIDILNKELNKIKFNFNLSENNYLKIFSTLDINIQNNVQKSIKLSVNKLRKIKKIDNIEVSMIIVDRKNGNIKSAIGGFNYDFCGYNRIFINRQIGSLIKPFIYISALDIPEKFNLNTSLLDKELKIKQDKKYWCPKNNDNKFRGKIKLMDSLIYSLNIPTINLGLKVGIDNIIKNLIKFGINFNKNINKFPSILLGSINLTLIEIAQIYQTISNYGNFVKLSSIKYILNNNDVLFNNKYKYKKVISSQASYLTLFCMQKITQIGTAKSLNKLFNNINIIGKTGTTNNLKDSWFVGIDDNDICIIWLGKDDNSTINLSGTKGALYVYKKYLEISYPKSFNLLKPEDIHEINIDKLGNFLCNKHNCEKIPVWTKCPNNYFINCPNHYFFKKFFTKFLN